MTITGLTPWKIRWTSGLSWKGWPPAVSRLIAPHSWHPTHTPDPLDPADKGLHVMTVDELKAFAAQIGVDISTATTKDEMIALIEGN